jgi:hypothetical protein
MFLLLFELVNQGLDLKQLLLMVTSVFKWLIPAASWDNNKNPTWTTPLDFYLPTAF